MKRKIFAVLIALGLVAGMSACSTRPAADEIVLYYEAGAGENKRFKECIEPGTSGANPWDDEIFALPTSARNWVISSDKDSHPDSTVPIKTGTKPVLSADGKTSQPGAEVVVYTNTDFYLNTDCNGGATSPIVKFWEKTGRRYEVSSDGTSEFNEDKWTEMLQKTLVIAQQVALRSETRRYTADELDANLNGVWQKIERQLANLFNAELNAKLGGSDYFCGPEFERVTNKDGESSVKEVEWTEYVPQDDGEARPEKKKGKCPPVRISITDINFADSGVAASRAAVFKAQQDAQKALIDARSESAVAREKAVLAKDPNYLRLKQLEVDLKLAEACARNANCTVVNGVGANVNVGK